MAYVAPEQIDKEVGWVYDALVNAGTDGLTLEDLSEQIGLPVRSVRDRIRRMRETFADDEATITCEPTDWQEPWIYRLVKADEDSGWWAANRVRDAKSRLQTIEWVMASVTNATDGRTREGREARVIHNALGLLRAQLQQVGDIMAVDGAAPTP